MSDHKFDRSTDRQITTLDAKQRLIDLMANPFILPDVDIYDEPVRYYKANEQWAKILFGWLDWLEDIAGWQEAEGDDFSGIQQVLKFEEGIEPIVTTPAELQEAIYLGLYRWTNDVAKQIVSGRTTDIAVDAEGNVSTPSEAGVEEPPADDPLTSIDETKAAKAGSAIAVALGVNQFIFTLNDLYGADDVADTPLADTIALINYLYVTDAGMDAAITEYYIDRGNSLGALGELNVANLAGHVYCNRFVSAENAVLQFVAASAFTEEVKFRYNELIVQLEETQWNIWQNTGLNAPSTQYLAFPCEPVPDYSLLLQFGAASLNDSHILKANHRYSIKATGYLLDPDGDIQDAWWHKQVGQNEVFDVSTFNIQQGGAIKIDPLVFEVPYSTTHSYLWSLDMGSVDASPQWTIGRHATMAVGSTSPSGGLLIEVHDEGLMF